MKYFEKHPLPLVITGVIGVSLSAIFVRYSQAPALITAAYRLIWTVLIMTPAVLANKKVIGEIKNMKGRALLLCAVSGIFLAFHFSLWFESLNLTSVASSTAIVCTEVIWVALGYCIFMKGQLVTKAKISIAITVAGSIVIAMADGSAGGNSLYGDFLALLSALFFNGVHAHRQADKKEFEYHGIYFYSVFFLRSLTVYNDSCFEYLLYRLRLVRNHRRAATVRFFNAAGAQYIQLGYKILFSVIYCRNQALSACNRRSVCIYTVFGNSISTCYHRKHNNHSWSCNIFKNRIGIIQYGMCIK